MKLHRLIAPALALAAFAPHAFADRFYFGTADAESKMTAETADFVTGVLLAENDGIYTIRVEGGELQIPKSAIRKIEKDGLTVDDLSRREADAATQLAEANVSRRQQLTAEASARGEQLRAARAAEASARREAAAAEASVAPLAVQVGYDPVLHVAATYGATPTAVQNELGGLIRRAIQKDVRDQLRRR